ncbi:SubName: Full=Uncharacterized protein {ECO:0000313/EMBL:CCA70337.1} [Serendipita indica DSM 11827]|nr:SubName: Full=Uncharacterized protein {ECO:0000313/EMBL:CCA70337.1} [Serendipita indica DSM 11827]
MSVLRSWIKKKTASNAELKPKSKRKSTPVLQPESTPVLQPESKPASQPESKLDHLGLLEIAPGIDPVVDIVAIHGLQGHRERTWTTDNGNFWLRDLLSSDLPNARILSYGYDADTHSRECVSTQTLGRHAEGFAHALSRERKDAPRRPIVFIAHNIGGIILKRALVTCHNQSLESKGHLRDILTSTHAVLFFGTPHFGVENTSFLEGINLVLSLYMETTSAILKDLQSHSTELENIQKDWIAASERISSIFFCEAYTTSNRGVINVPRPSAIIAGDPNARTIDLHANHSNLVRFPSRSNENYKIVHFYLKEFVDNAPEAVREKWVREDDCRNAAKGEPTSERVMEQSKVILDNFDKSAILELPLASFVPSSVHRTCLDGTRKDVLQMIWDWAENDSSEKPIFWLCDIAGSGKSTVAMSAAESWQEKKILGGGFFFSMSSTESSTTEKFCSTIARDIADCIPELAPHVAEAVKQNPSILRRPLDKQLQTLVVGPLDRRQERVILVIDALDECKSGSQRRELVEALSTAVQGSKNLKIFMTSRPDPVIQAVLGSLSIKAKLEDRLHDVRHHDNVDDIAVYVHRSLDGVLPEDKRQRLVGKANGLFIWASTACRMLTNETTMNTAESIYDQLISLDQPGAIDEVYGLIFERTDPNSYRLMCQMLAMLVAAFEPLSIDDLDDRLKHAGLRASGKAFVQNLGSVLSTDSSTNLIQFRHPTLVEYLRRCSLTTAVGGGNKLYIDITNAHGQAASWCLQYLKSPTNGLKFNICQLESSFYLNKQFPDFDARVSRFISKRLRYASSHWVFHMSETDENWRRRLKNEASSMIRIPYVLYWTEVLSLTGGVPRAIAGLRAVTRHARIDVDIRSSMDEIRRFLMAFSVPIQESTPHIYVSALAFTPKKSLMHIEGIKGYPNILSVTRGVEDTYPGLPKALRGHQGDVNAVAFSPDGSRIVSGSDDNTIRVWDTDTGQSLGEPLQGHEDSVVAVAFSPDGSQIVSGSLDKTLRLWDVATGEPLGEPLQGHEDGVMAVAFSPDGSQIVSGSSDNTLRLWDVATGEPLGEPLQGHESEIWAVAFSPDGSQIVSGSRDKTLRLWDVATGEPLGEPLQGHESEIWAVAFSPDGSQIVSGSRDKTLRLWDVATGEPLGEPLQGHEGWVMAVAFSPDGSQIVSGSRDKTLRLWDVATGEPLGEPLQGHESEIWAVAFSPDGSQIVSGSRDKTLRLWDVATGEPLGEPLQGHESEIWAVAFSPDGSQIVSGSRDKTLRLWDVATGEPLGEPLQGHEGEVMAVAFSPDGSQIVSGSSDKTLRLWDVATGEPLGEPLQGHEGSVMAVAFSPDGSQIVSGSSDKTLRLWDVATGEPLGEPLQGHEGWVMAVAFSPDGSQIVSGSSDKTLRLWDVATGEPLGEPLQGHENGSQIVSGSSDKTLRLWDVATGEPLGEPLQGHESEIWAVAFSPDGSQIVSGSRDKTLRLWDVATGEPLGEPLQGHEVSAGAAAFSPDDSQIVSGSQGHTIQIWPRPFGEPSFLH